MSDSLELDALITTLRRSADLGLAPDRQTRTEAAVDRRVTRIRARSGTHGPIGAWLTCTRWRIASVATATAAAIAGALMIALPASTPTAVASVPLTRTATSAVTGEPRATIQAALGDKADLDRAWSVPAFGGTAYLVRRGDDWCLSVPDPLTDQPDLLRGSSCVGNASFARFGIAITLNDNYMAVLPEGVRRPTIRYRGRIQSLAPSPDGVVVLERLPASAAVTRYATDGTARRDTIQQAPSRVIACPNGTTYTLAPGQPCP